MHVLRRLHKVQASAGSGFSERDEVRVLNNEWSVTYLLAWNDRLAFLHSAVTSEGRSTGKANAAMLNTVYERMQTRSKALMGCSRTNARSMSSSDAVCINSAISRCMHTLARATAPRSVLFCWLLSVCVLTPCEQSQQSVDMLKAVQLSVRMFVARAVRQQHNGTHRTVAHTDM